MSLHQTLSTSVASESSVARASDATDYRESLNALCDAASPEARGIVQAALASWDEMDDAVAKLPPVF
jgi:hypothetical protein